MKEKIAFVVQRYGLEVNGGSEYSCRLIAERLSSFYDVEVLTTKAVDYITWENHYKTDVEQINGVTVRRFSTDFPRNSKEFNQINHEVFTKTKKTILDEHNWMEKQGPVSYELIHYIKHHNGEYKKIIFFTYLYFTTFYGLQVVPEKSILVPTAHDEPYIYFDIFKSFFHLPKVIVFLTQEEKEFVHRLFNNDYIPWSVIGIGIEVPTSFLSEEEFRSKFNIHDPYIIYVGRIDESKGCKELFDYYLKYKKEHPDAPKLVLMGKSAMDTPKNKDIVSLGFVSEEEKYAGISGSQCLVMPSKYESLSMVVLESLYLNRPVLVNAECEVLVGHCKRGNAGLYYRHYEEFKACLNYLLENPLICNNMGINGNNYVRTYFDWKVIIKNFIQVIDQ